MTLIDRLRARRAQRRAVQGPLSRRDVIDILENARATPEIAEIIQRVRAEVRAAQNDVAR